MSATRLLITSFVSALFKVITLESFTKYKNLVLETLGLAISNYITTNNVLII